MLTQESYEAIIEFLAQQGGIRLKDHRFDDKNFGNFIISFINQDRERSLVCDRGELFLCNGLSGAQDCVMILPSLFDVSKTILLEALEHL